MSKSALPPRRAPLHPVDWVTQQPGIEDLPGAKLIAVSLLDPNPYQPRTTFDQAALEELAASIREHGVLQPLTVRQAGDRYQIGAGERRKRAAELADLADVPCVVRDLSDEQMEVLALVENVQRADLDPLDEAHAYRRLIDRFGLSLREVASRVKKSHEHIARRLRLIADPAVEDAVRAGTVMPTIAAELARVENPERRRDLLGRAEAGERLTLKDIAPSPAVTQDIAPSPAVTQVTAATSAGAPLAPSTQDNQEPRESVTYVTTSPSSIDTAPPPSRASNNGDEPVTHVTPAAAPTGDAAPLDAVPERPRHVRDGWIAGADLRTVVLLESTKGQAPRDQVRAALWADLEALEALDG